MTVNGMISEKEKTSLIDKYLSVEKIKDSEYYENYRNAFSYLENLSDYLKSKGEGLRNIDRIDAIPNPVYEKMKDEISKMQMIINSKESSAEERLKADQFINKFTVSISRYKVKKSNTVDYVYAGYNTIPIIKNCEYSFEHGIVFVKDIEKDQNEESNADNFI